MTTANTSTPQRPKYIYCECPRWHHEVKQDGWCNKDKCIKRYDEPACGYGRTLIAEGKS